MGDPRLKETRWDPALEAALVETWRSEPELYGFRPDPAKPVYVIDTPPPYPSGSWHIGAVMAYSTIDMIARAQRMFGRAVLFPFGLDRNGINIERTVEKKTKKPLHTWDREAFIEACRKEIQAIGQGMLDLAWRTGLSADFDHVYYTDSDEYRAFSQAVFLELWPRGLFYRGERPTFWCAYCETPLAEADIEYEERASKLVWMKFALGSGGHVPIATTRPELLAACRAVIVHPDDDRFAALHGKTARVPLYGHEVPIVAHPMAKPDFGSGAAMICSYGDMVDLQLFRELRLDPVKAIDERGRMTEAAGSLKGLTVEKARQRAIEDLESAGLLERTEPIQHKTPLCSRSATPIEFVSSDAWYMRQLEFRDELRRLAREMEFQPARHRQLLLDWIDSLTIDWPISRRRYYHTEIPLWYCKACGEVLAPPPGKYYRPWKDPAPFDRCPKCGSAEFVGEDRVFDTWMDSSVSNLFVTRYRTDPAFFEANFPTSLRPQGREIVRTWLYYSTLKSLVVRGTRPFRNVFIHGLGLDARGRAMHRTHGNVIDPWPLIEKHGADALRFFAASETNPGDDFRISEAKIGGAGKFITKLWNVARFISSFDEPPAGKLLPTDEWILAELNHLIEESRGAYGELNLFLPSNRCREFLWNLFAPHYVEMVKARGYAGDPGARWTLHTCLRGLLRLLAPVIPFSTDRIWRSVYGGSVHAELFPRPLDGIPAARREATDAILAFNSEIWKAKRDRGASLNVEWPGVAVPAALEQYGPDLRRMHRLV
ncbi:MAG: valine--tRNA ligase [Euryarchaeota archaeon RBG_16_67_27]|nr:MAG: valine--tRNA ligase [Euryarchaeota archaeon RBG_16_67_27]